MNHDRKEEVANAVSHGVGAILSMVALASMILYANERSITGYTIFGASMILLYLCSTLYHSIKRENAKAFFRKLDHIAIFVLIAGTYTPFCLLTLEGPERTILLVLTWSLATAGILLKIFFTGRYEVLSVITYISMGWLVLFFIRPIYSALSAESFVFLVTGGIFYTAGVFFYSRTTFRYAHTIWHCFVMAGTLFHYFSVITIPA